MTDTLPKVAAQGDPTKPPQGEGQPTPASNASKLPSIRGGKAGDRKDSGNKTSSTKADRDRKKAMELKNQPKDFFKLCYQPYVEAQKDEIPINDYYKRFLGQKIDRVTERSASMGYTQSTARSVVPDFETMIERNKRLNEIMAFAVMKEYHGMSQEDIKKHMSEIKGVQTSIDSDFEGATNIPKTGRTSLYQTIINQNQTRSMLRKKMFGSPNLSRGNHSPVSQSIISSNSARKNNMNWSRTKRDEKWRKNETISSSQHLMKYTSNQDTEEILYDASNLYLPPTQRLLGYDNRLRADRKLKPLPDEEKKRLQIGRNASSIMKQLGVTPTSPKSAKKSSTFKLGPLGGGQPGFARTIDVRSSVHSKNQGHSQPPSNIQGINSQVSGSSNRNLNVKFDLQLKQGVTSINTEGPPLENDQTFRQYENKNITSQRVSKVRDIQSETFQPSGRQNQMKFKKLQRRASFSMTQTKYKDAKTLWHPLKEAEGPILNDLATIAKMKAAKRYPVQEKLLHKPDGWDLFIDSIMHTAYNSDENEEWANIRKDIGAPANSMESMEVIDFESSSDEEQNKAIAAKDPIKEQIEALAKQNKTDEVVMYCRVHTDKKAKRKKGSLLPAILPPDTKPAQDIHQKMNKIRIHKDAVELHGFDLDILEQYPHRMRDGDIPTFLLKNNVTMFIQYPEIQQKIEFEFKHKNLFKTDDYIQLVFEQYCNIFNCTPLSILKFFLDKKLSFENYSLSVPQAKAVACTIPLLPDLKEIYFHNNDLGDQMCAVILMAAFQNPCLDSICIEDNKLGRSASKTFQELLKQCPKKINKLSLSHTKGMGTNLQNFIANIGLENDWVGAENPGCKLHTLNLSKIPISSAGCSHIGRILIHQKALRDLDINSCHIQDMGTRYVVDGLNRNIGLEHFNFANNGLQSEMYEFSIKMAKILTRHAELMHVDLTHTGLEREEVIFIGMTLSSSTSMLSLHLSLNELSYYDRIFLRTLINAKLVYKFKNMAQDSLNGIRSQSEKNVVDELGTGDFFDEDLKYFIKTFESIEGQKLDLDEDISKLMDKVDIIEIFNDIKAGKVKNCPPADALKAAEQQEVLTELIGNIKSRQMQIDAQREKIEKFHDQHIDLNDPQTIENFKTMGLYNRDKDGNPLADDSKKQEGEQQLFKEDLFLMSNALKIDRIRQRVEQDALKNSTRKGKSVGEIALQFNGINKIAYDLLQDIPMSQYTDKIIFTRILGQEAIDGGDVWKDTSQCYVREKWNLVKIEYHNDNREYMKQNIRKLGQLDEVLKKIEDPANHDQIQVLTEEKVIEIDYKLKNKQGLDEIAERSQEGSDAYGNESDNSKVEKIKRNQIEDQDNDYFDEESDILEEDARTQLANTNPLSNKVMGFLNVRKELPENFAVVQDIHGGNSDDSALQDSSDDEQVRFSGMQGTQSSLKNSTFMKGVNKPQIQPIGMMNNTYQNKHQQKLLNSDDQWPPGALKTPASIKSKKDFLKIAESEKKINYKYTRKLERDGVMYKIVERKVFFQGIEYTLEDEVKIDSDEETSIHTSEDDFQVDDDEVVTDVKEYYYNNPVKKNEQLDAVLKKNGHAYKERNEALRNVFGRKQIFMIASFNDWIPVEMKSLFEIKMEKKEGDNLLNFIKQNKEIEMKSEKPSHNQIQSLQYIPPGRHFFYFVYNRKRVILSPNYSIVRFKGTNVFLNQIEVKKRETQIKRVSIKRNLDEMAGGFRKEKSVFRTYQDDNEETTQMMMDQDMKYSKIMKDCRTEVEKQDLAKIIEKHYPKLKNIYMFQIVKSKSYPVMDQDDIDKFFTPGVIGRNLNKVTIDRLVQQTNLSQNQLKNTAIGTLQRYEFIELIVRVGYYKYKEQKPTILMSEASELFITKDILPRNVKSTIETREWREAHLYTAKVHEIMRKNEKELKQLFEKNLGYKQKYLHFDDVMRVLKKANLKVTDEQITKCFRECLMSRVDTLKDVKAANQMKYIEFIVMIGRIAFQIYKDTKEEGLDLHAKIDRILEPLLATELLTQAFSFNNQKAPALTTGGTEQSQEMFLDKQ